ncbi:hypothetical protein PPNK14_39150 [Pectobacterium parmentieri]
MVILPCNLTIYTATQSHAEGLREHMKAAENSLGRESVSKAAEADSSVYYPSITVTRV